MGVGVPLGKAAATATDQITIMVLKYDPKLPEYVVSADKMVLNVKRKMTKEVALQVLAQSKIYSKSAFPEGMLREAMEVLR